LDEIADPLPTAANPPLPVKRSVFLSHASVNVEVAKEVCALLEERGVSCWIAPRDIPPGHLYGEFIVDGIIACSVTVLVLTEQANASPAVANEIERSFAHHKLIIPLRLREVTPSRKLEFFLSGAQWVDAFYAPLKTRIDEIINVVHAVESGQSVSPPAPEIKTWVGRFERFLEQTLRHKMIVSLLVVAALGAIGGASLLMSSQTRSAQLAERRAIDLDASTLGLVKLTAQPDPSAAGAAQAPLSLWAAVYLNAKGQSYRDVQVRAAVESTAAGKIELDISRLLQGDQMAGAQTVSFNVPHDTQRVTVCMTAAHPTLGARYRASWSYRVSGSGDATALTRDREPGMAEEQPGPCV
jgi:type II secretory pathway pseudopilin PulG